MIVMISSLVIIDILWTENIETLVYYDTTHILIVGDF